jgi:DNA-damage-inducible protein J
MKTLQVRIPDKLRDDADIVLAQIGIDMPTAVRLYLNKIVQTRSIPFMLEAPDVSVESVEVDAETQEKMDAVGEAWKKRKA